MWDSSGGIAFSLFRALIIHGRIHQSFPNIKENFALASFVREENNDLRVARWFHLKAVFSSTKWSF